MPNFSIATVVSPPSAHSVNMDGGFTFGPFFPFLPLGFGGATGISRASAEFVTAVLPAGLASLRLHDLRHSTVSRMIAAGIPLPIIAKIVGWSASTMAKMAARYGHFGIEDLREAVEAISRPRKSEIEQGYPQNPPQSDPTQRGHVN